MTFYEIVFGWKYQGYGDQNYCLVTAGEKAEYGINGAIQSRTETGQNVINTITVEAIDEAIDRITDNGGKIVVPKGAIPNVGGLVYFQDTGGTSSAPCRRTSTP